MDCPKCTSELANGTIDDLLLTKHCHKCEGDWISGVNYQSWRDKHPGPVPDPEVVAQNYHLHYRPSLFDAKTGPCPECGRLMARGKITLKEAFYLEHCLTCGGIWCDRGEWEILAQLKLHYNIPLIFSGLWQSKARASYMSELERQAVIDKVGVELAHRVFDLADLLTKHPHGDFAAAYLLRRFEHNVK